MTTETEPSTVHLNWDGLTSRVPEISEILYTGDMSWLNQSVDRYEDGQVVLSNLIEADIDSFEIEQDQNEKKVKNAFRIMQQGLLNLKSITDSQVSQCQNYQSHLEAQKFKEQQLLNIKKV